MRMDGSYKEIEILDDKGLNVSLRTMTASQGGQRRCDGSATFTQGQTRVLAVVYGPANPVAMRLENPEKAVVDVVYRGISGPSSSADAARAYTLQNTLEATVLLSSYPQCVVSIVVQVLVDDGGVLTAALNAATMALMDAGVEMSGVAVSICCVVEKNSREVILDPNKVQESESAAIAVLSTTNQDDGGLLSSHVVGELSAEEFLMCISLMRAAAPMIVSFIRKTMETKVAAEVQRLR